MSRKTAYNMALGGVLCALAVVIMVLGGMLGIGTYAAPVLCCLVLELLRRSCGSRLGWVWFAATAILGLLLCPDKEAAFVFLFLGSYPLLKPGFDRLRGRLFWKLLYFNGVTAAMYWLLLHLLGMDRLVEEFGQLGTIGLAILLLLGNLVFFLLDKLLQRKLGRAGK